MTSSEHRALREKLLEFGRRSSPMGVALFVVDISVYLGAIAGIVYFESIYFKIACAVIAGTMTSALFVLGHDAAHGALTNSKTLNNIIGRIVFLPSLHNFSLWQNVHNKMHHGRPNLKNSNSWSPMTLEEYNSCSQARRLLERLYRTPLGFGPYYLVERWWKNKFFPWNQNKHQSKYLKDFLLLISYILGLVAAIWVGTVYSGHSSILVNLVLGTVVPFTMWNFSMGWTVYIQHTHESIPWFKNEKQWELGYDYAEFTPYIKFPRVFGFVFHDINEHTAHHLAPKIPCYKLLKAQKVVEKDFGDQLVSEKFSIPALYRRMRDCKLYDFDKHRWTDFNGLATTKPISVYRDIEVRVVGEAQKARNVASLIEPDQQSSEIEKERRQLAG